MFVVLYRWRVDFERQFVRSWSERTVYLRERYDSLGSRLHRGNDGIFYAYAQWQSVEQRENAFKQMPELAVREKYRESIAETFPEIVLDPLADYLIFPKKL